MDSSKGSKLFANFGGDLAAGLVVFFVAVPLCLGIALASGAPLFAGIVAGIIGGVVVGVLSKSQLSVSGPAAGLAAIVLAAITDLKAFDIFLCAVIIAGIVQLALGFMKAGSIANYFPSNVIEGMLAGIGLIIILKQLPHAVGYDKDYEGNESFAGIEGGNTFSFLADAFNFITPGAVVVALAAIGLMLVWEKVAFLKRIKILPGPLVAVRSPVVVVCVVDTLPVGAKQPADASATAQTDKQRNRRMSGRQHTPRGSWRRSRAPRRNRARPRALALGRRSGAVTRLEWAHFGRADRVRLV